MKKLSRFLVVGALFLSTHSFAESMNIRMNPGAILLGLANVGLDFKITNRATLGPSVGGMFVKSGATTASAVLLGLDSFFFLSNEALTDSWVLNIGIDYAAVTNTTTESGISTKANLGYWWFWPSGFNLGLGLGVQYVTISVGTRSGITASGFLHLGYAF